LADHGNGLAAAVDLRLPTGRQEELIGAGSTSVKFSGVGSIESGRTTFHAVGGVTVGGLAREETYGGALALAASDRITVIGEVIGRRIGDLGRVSAVTAPNPRIAGAEAIRLVPDGSAVQMLAAVPGVKWNIADTWIVVANVSLPITNGGLTSKATPFIALDYAWR
jgi:hypothetical protein